MNNSNLLILALAGIGFLKNLSGSKGEIKLPNDLDEIQKGITKNAENIEKKFLNGKLDLKGFYEELITNPYIYEWDSPNYGQRKMVYYLYPNKIVYSYRNIFESHPNNCSLKDEDSVEVLPNGDTLLKAVNSRIIKLMMQHYHENVKPFVFTYKVYKKGGKRKPYFQEMQQNELRYWKELSKYTKEVMDYFNAGSEINISKWYISYEALQYDFVPMSLSDISNLLKDYKMTAGAWYQPWDQTIHFTSVGYIRKAIRHQSRHSIDFDLKSRSKNWEADYMSGKGYRFPKKYNSTISNVNLSTASTHAQNPAELVTYIGDLYDAITRNRAFFTVTGKPLKKPSLFPMWKSTDDTIILWESLFYRNETGIPSENLLKIFIALYAPEIALFESTQKQKMPEELYKIYEHELLSTAYRAGREMYNKYKDYFRSEYRKIMKKRAKNKK